MKAGACTSAGISDFPPKTKKGDIMRILLADDHTLVRQTVASFLEQNCAHEVEQSGTLQDTLDKIKTDGKFDIVLLDLDMPGMDGLLGLETIIKAYPDQRVVLLTSNTSYSTVLASMDLGARGYIVKSAGTAVLRNALDLIFTGERFISSGTSNSSADFFAQDRINSLKASQRKILRLLKRGDSNKEISASLGVSEASVKMHIREMCRKLETKNRTQLAMFAERNKIV